MKDYEKALIAKYTKETGLSPEALALFAEIVQEVMDREAMDREASEDETQLVK
jgi:hypothetical protein